VRALDLIPVNHSLAARLAAGEQVEPLAGMTVPSLVQEVAAAQAALYEKTGAAPPWIGYLARDPDGGMLVGFCSFKDQPHEGQVEIAYFTFPEHEHQGYGLAMAGALVEIAFQAPAVTHILGHTLPERNASTRILSRLGFEFAGPVTDPEDGTVWRWVLKQPSQPRA
jgi:ribosomal-protein-alanine N-acetyltransferase